VATFYDSLDLFPEFSKVVDGAEQDQIKFQKMDESYNMNSSMHNT